MKYCRKESKGDYCVVYLDRPKVNALNMEMVQEIRSVFREIEADDTCRGVILTGIKGIFSAGLDIIELYDYTESEMSAFFTAFGNMHIELVQFSKMFISAINGHCPAGGTVIVLGADYRVMCRGEQYGIGLNELSVNVQITDSLIKAYRFWLGSQKAYYNIMNGNLLTPENALAAGLVDELVEDEELMPQAIKQMERYLSFDPQILKTTKAKLRAGWRDGLGDDAETNLNAAMNVWWSPEVRQKLSMFKLYIENKKKEKLKKQNGGV